MSAILKDFLIGPAHDGICVLLGLGWAGVAAFRFLLRQRILVDGPRSPAGLAMVAPHVLIALPFLLAGGAYTVWVPPIPVIVVTLVWLAFRWLRDPVATPGGWPVRGPVLAVLITASVLVELGALLAVRLVVVPDPRTPVGAALTGETWSAAWPALIQPLAGIVIAAVLLRRRRDRWDWRAALRRTPRPRDTALALVAVAVPFLLPLPFADGGPALTAGPVATPEYGKLILCAVLAWVVSHHSVRFQGGRLSEGLADVRRAASTANAARALYRNYRFLILPLAVFTVAAVASGLRRDFGTIVPAALATIGVTWFATRHNLDRGRLAGEGARRGAQLTAAYRMFAVAAVLFIAAATTLLTTDYVGERGRVWNDPWRFRWDAPCAVVDAPPQVDSAVPEHRVACLRSLTADTESERSQIARAIAATADGGLWGRGVRDRVSAAVPAGATDFVLAVIWNKLGGLVVIASGLLLALLSAALVRAAATAGPSVPMLFAAGLGATLTGQFLFVLAATANVVPHTGIPAPLLSRGGQSTLAICIGIALVLATSRPEEHDQKTTPAPVRVITGTVLAAFPVIVVVVLTLIPYAAPRLADRRLPTVYAQHRPLCPARTADLKGLESPPPDPAACSTDLITLARTRLAVSLGAGRLVLDRQSGDWEDDGDLSGLRAGHLGALLGVSGALRATYPWVMQAGAGGGLRERLTPAPYDRIDAEIVLTLEPRRQRVAAEALTGLPAAAAFVALDTTTGRILVSASATPGPDGGGEVPDTAKRRFDDRHRGWVRPDPAGRVDDSAPDPDCRRRSPSRADQDGCVRWSYVEPGGAGSVDGVLGRSYPYGGALDPVRDAVPAEDLARQAARLGLRTGGCTGPDQWMAGRLDATVSSCLPDPARPGTAHGTPLTLAVIAGAVANGGAAVHPRLVERVTYPATGVSVTGPPRPPAAAFPAATAERLKASRYPDAGGLRLLTAEVAADGGTYLWACGFTGGGRTAFAVVTHSPDPALARASAGLLPGVIRTTIGDR
ncbi:FtsW/RodA/SpoVE family cell cycle protein [Actinoplanes sp. G11-F43]|uniref:FtsW/RodA/SpoVE family cell cycle protein n=1 Tax=Actinoplanes sp. G11-F43 TaxID=3424130 RepID=UPI003D3489DC